MAKYGTVDLSKDEWITPKYITDALGPFDLDVCAPDPRRAPWQHATACYHFPTHDGMRMPWYGRIWCNPPYIDQAVWKWIAKLAAHGNGIALLNSTTETEGFQREVLRKADAILWVAGRISFYHVDGTPSDMPMQGSVLAAYGIRNVDALGWAVNTGLIKGVVR